MQFQATCSKWSKRLRLTLSANNIEAARSILHGQWYSIIELHEALLNTNTTLGNFFYFDARVNGILQSGKIQSTDIFKSYKKLTEDLKYEVIYIYTNEGMPEESKKVITAKVKDGYRLYKESLGEDMDEQDELRSKTQDQQEMQEISGEVLKEIEKFSKVIDSSIEKIQNIFLRYHDKITSEQKINLENLENSLIQTKGTKNLWKIATTVENGLRMIGETELALMKTGMTDEKQKYLDETNALLKKVGSHDRIESDTWKEDTLEYKLNHLFEKSKKTVPVWVVETTGTDNNSIKKDTNSFIYFKNKRELDIYKKKLNITEIDIIKKILTFQFSKVKKLLLKKKLIAQNIEIINNRINNRVISYTKILHGIEYHINNIYHIIDMITSTLVYTIFLYTVAYILLRTLDMMGILSNQFQWKSMLFITLFVITTFFLSYIRGIKSTIIALPMLFFALYFLSINF